MTKNRYARRIDANQPEIVEALRKMGVAVIVANAEGYDLITAAAGKMALVEVKDGSKPPSAQKLTPAELDLLQNWPGDYVIVANLDQAADLARRLLSSAAPQAAQEPPHAQARA